MEDAPITTINQMNLFVKPGFYGSDSQVDDPQVRQKSSEHQSDQALWIGKKAFVQVETFAFLV